VGTHIFILELTKKGERKNKINTRDK